MAPRLKDGPDVAGPVQPDPVPPEFALGEHLHAQIVPEFEHVPDPGILGGLDEPVGFGAAPAVAFALLLQQRHGRQQQEFHLPAGGALPEHPSGDDPRIVGDQ